MISEFARKNNSFKVGLPVLLALMLMTITVGTSRAAWPVSQGFAFKSVSNVRGTRVSMYTGAPPSPFWFIANLTAICVGQGTTCPSGSDFFETGWIRGVQTGGLLLHYISYRGGSIEDFDYGDPVSEKTWYLFQTLHSNSASRWEGWINGVPELVLNFSLGWTSGNLVNCGLESAHTGTPPTAAGYCKDTRYKIVGGNWTYYTHTREHEVDYCVMPAWTFGSIAYGPVTGACP